MADSLSEGAEPRYWATVIPIANATWQLFCCRQTNFLAKLVKCSDVVRREIGKSPNICDVAALLHCLGVLTKKTIDTSLLAVRAALCRNRFSEFHQKQIIQLPHRVHDHFGKFNS